MLASMNVVVNCKECLELSNIDSYKAFIDPAKSWFKHIWLYDYDVVREVLLRAKFRGQFGHYSHLAPLLCRAIICEVNLNVRPLYLTYIPTLSFHVRQRGFDHCLSLAKAVSNGLGVRVTPCLIPTHNQAQVGSNRLSRQANPHFQCSVNLKGATVIVLDDISTTRSTLFHSAIALKKSGAKSVFAVTLANRSI